MAVKRYHPQAGKMRNRKSCTHGERKANQNPTRSRPDPLQPAYSGAPGIHLRKSGRCKALSRPKRQVCKPGWQHSQLDVAPTRTQRLIHVKMGSPVGRESYGDGPPIVVRARESLVHGEGAALEGGPEPVADHHRQGRYRRVTGEHGYAQCDPPALPPGRISEQPGMTEVTCAALGHCWHTDPGWGRSSDHA